MKYQPPFYLGGLACLDFCNTLDHRHEPPRFDMLSDYAALLRWAQAAGLLPVDFHDPAGSADRSLAPVRETRSLLLRLFMSIAHSEPPAESDLAAFNARWQAAAANMQIVSTAAGYALSCTCEDAVERIMCGLLHSAADLLLANRPEQIKACEGCTWLFQDTSRNHLRRWCEMESCGNRAKARRHYERVRQAKAAIP